MDKAKSIADIQELIRKKAAELGPGQWITGFGWDEALLAEKRNILRSDLDAAAPKNPVALTRAGGHSIVGNTQALKIAKIDRNTPDPQSGLIEKDAQGEPNGIIRERNDLYLRNVPRDKWDDMRGGYVATMKWLLTLGITSVFTTAGIEDEPVGQGGVKEPGPGPTLPSLSGYREGIRRAARVALHQLSRCRAAHCVRTRDGLAATTRFASVRLASRR